MCWIYKKKKKKTSAKRGDGTQQSATHGYIGSDSRSREVPKGAMEKASFMEDSIGHELGFGEVYKAQRTETHINGGMLQHKLEVLRW